MIKFLIDSGSDFTSNDLNNQIDFLPYYILLNNKIYISDINWKSITFNDFKLDSKPNISQPPVILWTNQLEEYLKQGYDILYLSITKELSGGYKSFYIARNLLKSKYNNRMEVIDSDSASAGTKLLAKYIIEMINQDYSIDKIIEETNKIKNKIRFFSVSKSLLNWINTGRSSDRFVYPPPGVPVMKGHDSIMSLDKLCKSKEEAFDYLSSVLPKQMIKSGITYSFDEPKEEIEKFKSLLTNIQFENNISPTIFAVGGPETICISYIE